ncbi:MAG TPA: hypothetical protein VF796_18355, partial [Humisphaera sp.]
MRRRQTRQDSQPSRRVGRPPLTGAAAGRIGVAASRVVAEVIEPRMLLSAAPQAVVRVADVTAAGGTELVVTVDYTDDVKVARTSIDSGDIAVTPAGGGAKLAFKSVTTSTATSAPAITATYVFAAPGGAWDPADDGAWVATVQANRVFDQDGNGVAPTSATFAVNAVDDRKKGGKDKDESDGGGSGSGSLDAADPAAAVAKPADVTAGGGANASFTVTYTDDIGIDPNSIGAADLTLAGPGGSAAAGAVTYDVKDGGRTVVAVYTVVAPGGTWDAADNGTYTVSVGQGAVTDLAGKGIAGNSATFAVQVDAAPAVPPPP